MLGLHLDFATDANENCYTCNLNNFNLKVYNEKLSILFININGLRVKIHELRSFVAMSNLKFTVIALTEVKLDSRVDADLEIPGYLSIANYRNEFGGGIKLFYLDFLNVVKVDDNYLTGLHDTHESLCVTCDMPNFDKITINVIYRPPEKLSRNFCNNMEYILERFNANNNIFLGDFNMSMFDIANNASIRDFVDLFTSCGYINCITKPTYIIHGDTTPSSLIDHCWMNTNMTYCSYLIEPPISDHLSCIVVFNKNVNRTLVKHSFRDYSSNSKSRFLGALPMEYANYNVSNENINTSMNGFDLWVRKLTDKYFPIRNKFISNKRLQCPWLTTRLIKCIRMKYWLYNRVRVGIISLEMYKAYTNLLKYTLRTAEQFYRKTKFDSLKGNSRKTWSFINEITGRKNHHSINELCINGTNISDNNVIANSFAQYFSTIPIEIKSKIVKPVINLIDIIPNNANSMFLIPATDVEVEKIISKLKRSNERFDLSVIVLKLGSQYFSQCIADLFNQSVTECNYPTCLKIARVAPIYKKGNKKLIENYRPVSVLPVINKIFEKLILKRLNSFLDNNKILCNNQHGFRSGCSTDTASLDFVRYIIPAFANKTYSLCVFLDQSKAFDLVEHSLLLSKMGRYGIRGHCLDYFRSYLSNRASLVALNSAMSDQYPISASVPQGSVLGPVLFNLYTNDLCYYIVNSNITVYADDAALVMIGPDLNHLTQLMNSELLKLSVWCRYNGLSLNSNKTKFMIFTNMTIDTVPTIYIDGTSIEYVSQFKYLGLIFDHKLSFSLQIDNLIKRLSCSSGITYKIGDSFNLEAARSYYFSFYILNYFVRHCCLW